MTKDESNAINSLLRIITTVALVCILVSLGEQILIFKFSNSSFIITVSCALKNIQQYSQQNYSYKFFKFGSFVENIKFFSFKSVYYE